MDFEVAVNSFAKKEIRLIGSYKSSPKKQCTRVFFLISSQYFLMVQ